MRLRLFSEKGASIRQSQRRSWVEIGVLIMLAAAILRLGGDLASQWRLSAESIGPVEADLHAKGKADYSADPLDAIIPPISPAILEDLFGLISPPWETPGDSPDGNLDSPADPQSKTPAVTVEPPTPTSTSDVPHQTEQPTRPVFPTRTVPAETSPTPTPTNSQNDMASATPTRPVMSTPTPTRSLTPWISPTRTPTPANSPTHTPTRKPTAIDPTKTPSPSIVPSKTPTRTQEPTIQPPTLTPEPDTSTPTPKTPTPFVTRDPTRALTPTGYYTPGGTSAPTTVEPPTRAVEDVSNCKSTSSQLRSEEGCLTVSSLIGKSSERSLWQAFLEFLGLDFRRGVVVWVSRQ